MKRNYLLWGLGLAAGLYFITRGRNVGGAAFKAQQTVTTTARRIMGVAMDLASKFRTSDLGRLFIQRHEGYGVSPGESYSTAGYAYKDPAGFWTIGYGHMVTPAEMAKYVGKVQIIGGRERGSYYMTRDEADALLAKDVATAEAIVRKHVTAPISQDMFDALVSFVFNVGPGKAGVKDGLVTLKSGKPSTLLTKVNAGDYFGAAAEFPRWANAGGQQLPGLVTRRNEEARKFTLGLDKYLA